MVELILQKTSHGHVLIVTTQSFVPFFNPRTQNWDDEFVIEVGVISGKTPSARVTVTILQMNEAERVEAHRLLMEAGFWD